eukprot:SAG31_NODE_1257_length_9081_cov_7.585838_6_plen_393_part_00
MNMLVTLPPLLAALPLFRAESAASSTCNCSAAAARQGWTAGEGSLSGRRHAVSAQACCALCSGSSSEEGCILWEWQPSAQVCWLKNNARGGQPAADRITGSCAGLLPPLAPPPSPPPPSTQRLALHFDSAAPKVATTSRGFVSYTLDWWAPSQGARPEGWGAHANVLELDFESAKLRALVRALGPSYLRIGGSLDKDVIYQMPGTTESCPTSSERGAVPTGGLCLNSSRWDALHNFAAATDSKIVFGLSYPEVGSPDKKSDDDGTDGGSGIWNSTQAEALFAYSNQRGFRPSTTLFGFELGEELTKFKAGTPAFAAYVASYHRAAALLRSVFDHKDDVPKLMGPCPGMAWPQLATWYPSFLKGTEGALDISVYHSYNQVTSHSSHHMEILPA